MKAWVYGVAVLFSVVLLIGCEQAGAGGDGGGTAGDGTDDGTSVPLPGEEINLSGSVARQIDPNQFDDLSFANPSDAVIFFAIDSGFTFSIIDQDTPATRDYSFDLTIPVPDESDLLPIPPGVTSTDPDARIVKVDLFGAREDGIVYESSDVLGYGTLDGTKGSGQTVTLTYLAYLYADRETTLNGTITESGIALDSVALEPGWNEILTIIEVSYGPEEVILSFSQALSNGSAPANSDWILVSDFLRPQVEEDNLDGNSPGSAFIAFDSEDPQYTELFIRGTLSDPIGLSFPNQDPAGRQALFYFGLTDADNADSSLDDDTYTLDGEDGTDMYDAFVLVYSEEQASQITAGVGDADNTTNIDGSPLGSYLQITGGSLTYDPLADFDYQFALTTSEGDITGNYDPSSGTRSFDYADYDF